jgi:ketosteroid isomerase-like protein
MSQENVEIVADDNIELVRHALDLYNTGDVDAFVDLFTDDGEVETDPRFPEGGTFSGRESVRRFIAGLHQGWAGGSAVTVKEMRRAGDSVLAYWSWHAKGERSGIDVSSDWFGLWTLRGGRVARLRFFYDRAEALEAAGLSE